MLITQRVINIIRAIKQIKTRVCVRFVLTTNYIFISPHPKLVEGRGNRCTNSITYIHALIKRQPW